MPRNSQGLYTLPAGNPVVPNTLIEANWANPTMDDIATALTGSLPRDGSAPMVGPLTLAAGAPTQSRHAVSKGYMEQFLAYATGMPIGAVFAVAGTVIPPGTIECNGQAVSRTTYADLFATIGTTYGVGDSSTTFNVPDLRDYFIRGKADARTVGSVQPASLASHTHPTSDPGHGHALSDPGHAHGASQPAHTHGVNDAGHSHSTPTGTYLPGYEFNSGSGNSPVGAANTGAAATGISLQAAQPGVTVNAATTGASVATNTTGLVIGAAGGAETVPQNYAMIYVIKSVDDAGNITGITGVDTSDAQMIAIDNTNPVVPLLDIKSNVAFGTVKLDANAKVPQDLIDISTFQYLGPWDASGGQNPSQALPSEVFVNGDLYQISVGGTIQLYDAAGVLSSIPVVSTDQIVFVTGSTVGNPTGWYFQPTTAITGITAVAVSFAPAGGIGAVNVQAAIEEVAAEAAPVTHVGTGGTQHANVVAAGAAGFMTGADKSKLDGVEAGAQVNTVQSVNTKTGVVTLTAADVGALTQAGADSLYVNVSGDTMSGGLKVGGTGLTFPDNTVQSTAAVISNGPAFAAGSVGGQSFTSGTASKFNCVTELFDTDADYDAPNSRFTPQVAGYYQVNLSVSVQAATGLVSVGAQVRKNGNATAELTSFIPMPTAGTSATVTTSGLIHMNGTTDYIESWVIVSGTGALTAVARTNSFSASLARAE